MYAEWVESIWFFWRPPSLCDMMRRLPWQRAVLSRLLMPASLCSLVKMSLGDLHVVWPIIPHKEQGDASTYFYYKAFTSPLSFTGMLLYPPASLSCCPVCPALSSQVPAWLVLPGVARSFNLFPPFPVLALTYQPCWCPTLSAPTELWLLTPPLLPHILHLTLDL